jgi:hypothetical protein
LDRTVSWEDIPRHVREVEIQHMMRELVAIFDDEEGLVA